MQHFIGHIHDTRNLSETELEDIKTRIKKMLVLDSIEIGKPQHGFYPVSTNDTNIIDFKLDNYNNNNISLVKYHSSNDEGKRDTSGATLTWLPIVSKE